MQQIKEFDGIIFAVRFFIFSILISIFIAFFVSESILKCSLIAHFLFSIFGYFYLNNKFNKISVHFKKWTAKENFEKQKENFTAGLVHDLKTPATAQIRAIELILKSNNLNENHKIMLSEILNSCKYMLSIISNILSSNKLENGGMKFNKEIFELTELEDETCEEVKYLTLEKNLKLTKISNSKNSMVFADRVEIKRVMTNLITNAIKYSPQDSEIIVQLNETKTNVEFMVINESENLSNEDLTSFFNKYYSNAHRFKHTGNGLGLYVSKQIVLSHGGKIGVEKIGENALCVKFELKKENSPALV